MSPGKNLRLIFRNYPGFVNKTYIDWIQKWPLEALNAVAEKVLISVGYFKFVFNNIFELYTYFFVDVYCVNTYFVS